MDKAELQWDRRKWILVGVLCVVAVVTATLFTGIFDKTQSGQIPRIAWILGGLIILVCLIMILSTLYRLIDAIHNNGVRLEQIADEMEKNRLALEQINQSNRLSDIAKAIAYRDLDQQILRDAVFDKLQQKDFQAANQIIAEIAQRAGYKVLADQLKRQADTYHDATDAERVNQVIDNINKLLDTFQWSKAAAQIERLISEHPNAENAKAMRQKLIEKKDERKKQLLTEWDEAVKARATDRGLQILRELDMYLTPNEALALQEAARDVFRSKLHNLGVEFSLAISSRQWQQALTTGQKIMQEFPNSRMAQEIREKFDALKQRAVEAKS